MVDVIKEASDFIQYIATNEQAQLTILIGVIGSIITAFVSFGLGYVARQA